METKHNTDDNTPIHPFKTASCMKTRPKGHRTVGKHGGHKS